MGQTLRRLRCFVQPIVYKDTIIGELFGKYKGRQWFKQFRRTSGSQGKFALKMTAESFMGVM
jgi:hypothetical protein